MNGTKQTAIQRILLALDASPQSVAALDTATELAGRLGAELTGLFVEDTDLLRMAALPFAAEIGRLSPEPAAPQSSGYGKAIAGPGRTHEEGYRSCSGARRSQVGVPCRSGVRGR